VVVLALGDAGAKVYVTGRSVRGEPTTEGLSGTIDETSEEVTARGGTGIPVRCDHMIDHQTEALFDRIARDDGKLDLLVNNAWSGYERVFDAPFDAPFWEQPLWRWDLFASSVRGHFAASRLAAPLMLPQRHGLIVKFICSDRYIPLGQSA
jgi:NAD(P)-dependent dehydrogenase (short-subunit alcohol dehydrogenase family)